MSTELPDVPLYDFNPGDRFRLANIIEPTCVQWNGLTGTVVRVSAHYSERRFDSITVDMDSPFEDGEQFNIPFWRRHLEPEGLVINVN